MVLIKDVTLKSFSPVPLKIHANPYYLIILRTIKRETFLSTILLTLEKIGFWLDKAKEKEENYFFELLMHNPQKDIWKLKIRR